MSDDRDPTHRVLAQADALMRRHRVFLAGAGVTAPENSGADDEDIPVLLDIVPYDAPRQHVTEDVAAQLSAHRQTQIRALIDEWLDEHMPAEIQRVMDGISDQLIASLANQIRGELLPKLLTAAESETDIPLRPEAGSR